MTIVFGHLYMQSREEYQPSTVLWWYRVTDVRAWYETVLFIDLPY